MASQFSSWGRYPQLEQRGIYLNWADEGLPENGESLLPFGMGRSYGDSCLNTDGLVLATSHMNRFLSFDETNGILKCEAGVTLAEIIDLALPRGWFPPVTPGTKYVTLGGAIANDVHGKNHHKDGTFGHHVSRFELLQSSGERIICSEQDNAELFYATIGGLGLTGLITWAEIRLKPVESAFMDVETIRFDNLQAFKTLSDESSSSHLYTVAWVDCQATGEKMGRGLFMRANHATDPANSKDKFEPASAKKLNVPFVFPQGVLNTFTIKNFNRLYYGKQLQHFSKSRDHYDKYFYPLDAITNWNRIYGPRGFFQYQFLVPHEDYAAIEEALGIIAKSGAGSFLAVLKEFGDIPSVGMLSFPRPGVCLALDFPNQGESTLALLQQLDDLVVAAKGAVYPAKDARMAPEAFAAYFPRAGEFSKYVDPRFSSNFWRRVQGNSQ